MFSLMVDRRRARIVLVLNCYVIVYTETLCRRFEIYPFSMCENAVHVWTEPNYGCIRANDNRDLKIDVSV